MSQVRTVIAFTSDRSGIGQSMAVASIALMLAANGRRVLAIDWDFAKPSLVNYFIPFVPADALEGNNGMIDARWSYGIEARRAPPAHISDLQRRFLAVSPIECAIRDELCLHNGGALHLLPAGREPQRSLRERYFSWGEFFDRLDGESLLATLWKELQRRYDHILIDCPQGPRVSNAARFPILRAGILVACSTLDRESMKAGAALARWASALLPDRRLLICPLACGLGRMLRLSYYVMRVRIVCVCFNSSTRVLCFQWTPMFAARWRFRKYRSSHTDGFCPLCLGFLKW